MRHLCMIFIAILIAIPAHAGMVYQFEMASQGDAANISGTARVEGDSFRLELSEGDGVIFKDRSVILSSDGGRTMMVLDPKRKEYYRLSIEESVGAMNAMLQSMGGMVEMSVSNPKVDVRQLGAGEAIEGYPTKKYQVDTSYRLNLKAMGMDMSQDVQTQTTTWTTGELEQEMAAFITSRSFRTGIEGLDELMSQQMGAVEGFPLKVVTKSEITARGRTNTSTSTMTVSGIKEADIAESEFNVPAGYREVDGPLAALKQMQ